MTEHVTIPLDHEYLEQARREALRHGVSLETYLSDLVQGRLPTPSRPPQNNPGISAIFGIGASVEQTDIARDKDSLLGDATWREHLRKTQQSS